MTGSPAGKRKLSSAIFKTGLLALLGSVTLLWTFMTPFGGVADELAYAKYANVVASGQGYGQSSVPAIVVVPAYIAGIDALSCFAFKPDVTAHCQQKTGWETLGERKVSIGTGNLIMGYPEPYFWIVGQPSRILSGFHAAYLMRLFSWGLGMSLLALMVVFWPRRHRSSLVIAALLAATPMVGSLIGSINPNGFEIVSGLSLAGLLAALMLNSAQSDRTLGRTSIHLASIFLVMMALSIAKPWSYVYTLAITMAFLLGSLIATLKGRMSPGRERGAGYRRPEVLWMFLMLGTSIVVGFASNATYRFMMGQRGTTKGVLPLWDATYGILTNFTGYALELIGFLGWRDHRPPLFVLVLWASAIVAFVIYALGRLPIPYRVLLLGFISGVILVIPAFSNRALGLLGGAGFQTRYVGAVFCAIPFIVVAYQYLGGVSLEVLPVAKLAPTLVWWFFVLQLTTVFWSFLRYSVGFPLPKAEFGWIFQWLPNYWIVALLALVVFALSSFVVRIQLRDPASWSDESESTLPGTAGDVGDGFGRSDSSILGQLRQPHLMSTMTVGPNA
jgi:hypothetical protein